ncbi:MAG: hypothetical protein U9R17_11500 [Thermodesulfobacteriota bacterium]|nr:hypothetical protein [Thermodesulfobacteriota bacterium]
MSAMLTDQDIALLIGEKKVLPADYRKKIQVHPKRGHKERDLDVKGSDGSDFRLIVRQSLFNPLDFSIILGYRPENSNQFFRLRRYNGKSHEHTNPIEGNIFYDFHIHQATERYQELGAREDTFAKPTKGFSDFNQAVSCMINECGFETPFNPQTSLFEEA